MGELPHPEATLTLRAAFDRAGFTEPVVNSLLGLADLPTDRRLAQSLPVYLWRTRQADTLTTLVRLFVLGQAVPAVDAANALTDGADGLLRRDGEAVRAAVQIVPVQDLWIAADWINSTVAEPVMGVAASTRALAQMMIPAKSGRVLDLGAGSGVLAVMAARQADCVMAVDLNPRAAEFVRFNAALNGVANIDARTGDLFEPVGGETFDRIVCNPPFVIAPAAGRMHSQAGRPADDLLRSIIRAAPAYLRPGGYCQVIGNWVIPASGDWQPRLAGWFDGLECDAWVLHARTEDAATYAHQRIAEMTDDPETAGRQFDAWIDAYENAGIAAVGYGIITLRKSPHASPWFRCDPLPEVAGPCGGSIERGFAARDFLAAHADDRHLLAVRVRRADGLRWERQCDLTATGWTAGGGRLRLTSGLMFAGAVEPPVAEFVARCSGSTSLGDDLSRLAGDLGRDRDRFAPAFLAVVRRLIEVGILEPKST